MVDLTGLDRLDRTNPIRALARRGPGLGHANAKPGHLVVNCAKVVPLLGLLDWSYVVSGVDPVQIIVPG